MTSFPAPTTIRAWGWCQSVQCGIPGSHGKRQRVRRHIRNAMLTPLGGTGSGKFALKGQCQKCGGAASRFLKAEVRPRRRRDNI